jgi:hypothetical protein
MVNGKEKKPAGQRNGQKCSFHAEIRAKIAEKRRTYLKQEMRRPVIKTTYFA